MNRVRNSAASEASGLVVLAVATLLTVLPLLSMLVTALHPAG